MEVQEDKEVQEECVQVGNDTKEVYAKKSFCVASFVSVKEQFIYKICLVYKKI